MTIEQWRQFLNHRIDSDARLGNWIVVHSSRHKAHSLFKLEQEQDEGGRSSPACTVEKLTNPGLRIHDNYCHCSMSSSSMNGVNGAQCSHMARRLAKSIEPTMKMINVESKSTTALSKSRKLSVDRALSLSPRLTSNRSDCSSVGRPFDCSRGHLANHFLCDEGENAHQQPASIHAKAAALESLMAMRPKIVRTARRPGLRMK